MITVIINSGRSGYRDILNTVVHHGRKSQPRALKTLDAGPVTVILRTPYDALPIGVGRSISRRIAAAEAMQLISGFSIPSLLPSSFDRFKEDDGSFWGAYGIRIANQLEHIVRKLKNDPDTRQAIITLWNPDLDNEDPPRRDHPCTIALGFRIINDTLRLNVLMRSSDAWLGIPYDWFQFTSLQLSVAHVLGITPGLYTHTTWSLHLYEQDIGKIDSVSTPTDDVWYPRGIDSPHVTSIASLRGRALNIAIKGNKMNNLTPSEKWYSDALFTQ